MPKMKTHRGAAKRFRKTATGKLKRAHSHTSHLLVHKSAKRARRLHRPAYVSHSDLKRIAKLVPYL